MLGKDYQKGVELSKIATARGKHLCRPLTRAWVDVGAASPRSPPGGIARWLYSVAVCDG
ncbi:MAG: hypothetical protein M3430_04440 [Acidobacteriota bacterium]|nr:hypothetical protein [Acidobacteriota bacterium]